MPMSPRLLRPRQAGGFDPRTISGLMGWWDFSDAAILGPTSSGPGAVSENGPVKYVGDKSGRGLHMTQTGADSVSPSFLGASQNGRSVLSFDGGDFLNAAGSVSLTSQSVFQVFFHNTSASFARTFSQSDAGEDFSNTGHYIPVIQNGTNQGIFGSFATGLARATRTFGTGVWGLFSSVHTGAEIQNRVNNGASATFAHTLNKTFTRYSIGGDVRAVNTQTFFTGRVAETVVYDRNLSDTERDSVSRWLGAKWGITVS